MLRQYAYPIAGALLSAGAPIGLLGAKRAARGRSFDSDAATLAYVAASTAAAFTLFGYLLGRTADRLARLSETDALTGLANARGFFNRLNRELVRSRRYHEPLALLLVDLDGLKSINDRFGHRAGDDALRGLGEAIRAQLRATDLGARWGGDEFAVLAPNTSKTAAVALAERIRTLVPPQWYGPLTGSIGVAAIDGADAARGADAAALMRAADAALYDAKRRGRNQVVSAAALS